MPQLGDFLAERAGYLIEVVDLAATVELAQLDEGDRDRPDPNAECDEVRTAVVCVESVMVGNTLYQVHREPTIAQLERELRFRRRRCREAGCD